MDRARIYFICLALAGAILFGASAPLAKLLLADTDPLVLSGLLYAGCGVGLLLLAPARPRLGLGGEARPARGDLPWLAGSIAAGGIIAPLLLLIGLQSTPAATASLLLNFECVATTAIAALAFREAVGRRVWLAVALITAACALLTVSFTGGWGFSPGALAVVGACLFWGIDNNLTCYISSRDPVIIGTLKGLIAGAFSLGLALALGRSLPGPATVAAALLLGAVSYGLSIVLYILATRGLGAARTSAWFGTAPFAGTALSLGLFRAWPGLQFIVSLPVMAAGALLLFGEEHDHMHVHVPIEHEHYFREDAHHPFQGPGRHRHPEVRHSHPHSPDIHHRHGHEPDEPDQGR